MRRKHTSLATRPIVGGKKQSEVQEDGHGARLRRGISSTRILDYICAFFKQSGGLTS